MESLHSQLLALQRGGDRLDHFSAQRIERALEHAELDRSASPRAVTASSLVRRQRRLEEEWPSPSQANIALVEAVAQHDPSAVQAALSHGADVNFRAGPFDEPVLTHAVRRGSDVGDESIVGMLLAEGALPNAAGRQGETPLHAAAAVGNARMVDLLSKAGADPLKLDLAGRTPRELAVVTLGAHQVASHPVFDALDKAEARSLGPSLSPRSHRSGGISRD